MPILYAELQTAGVRAECARASYSFYQPIDYEGRPSSDVHVGLIKVTLTGEAAAWPVWKRIKLDPYRRQSGHLVFFEAEGQKAKQVTFYDAALVHYQSRLDARGQGREAALVTELHFSAALVEVQGQRVQAYSIIPWATDAATSFRALTPPPPLLPSLALRAETLASGLLQRVVTPAGEVATELLGVGLSAIARAASLTAGLVLTPANDPNAPGYDAEKDFSRDHPTLPPDPDAFRLAELEARHAAGTLTAAEEAEMIALLAKVKGVRVQSLADLDVEGPLKGALIPLKGFHAVTLQYTKRDPADAAKLRRAFDSTERKRFLKNLSSDPEIQQELRASGLTQEEIEDLADGIQPDKYQVHHKFPLDDGGDNSFDNLMLIKNDPYHKSITNLQIRLTRGMKAGDTRQVQWPIINRSVYP